MVSQATRLKGRTTACVLISCILTLCAYICQYVEEILKIAGHRGDTGQLVGTNWTRNGPVTVWVEPGTRVLACHRQAFLDPSKKSFACTHFGGPSTPQPTHPEWLQEVMRATGGHLGDELGRIYPTAGDM